METTSTISESADEKTALGAVRIGTSGWHYKHWLGKLYAADLPANQMLSIYMEHFDTVELNNTFYHLPAPVSVENWYRTVPDHFCFAVKASRYLTHLKRLKDPEEGLEKFFSTISNLREKTGPILFQLPPKFRADIDRLDRFLAALPGGYKYTFEFRDPSWESEIVYSLLREYNVAYCIVNKDAQNSLIVSTADFMYVRLHGGYPEDRGNYRSNLLEDWALKIGEFRKEMKEIYLYFNNDWEGYAIDNAKELLRLLGKQQH